MLVLLLSLLLFCGYSQAEDYTLIVKTSDVHKAGTDATIKIRIYGTTGSVRERAISGSFEQGSTDRISFQDYPIGRVTGMAVRRNQNGFFPDWRLDRITVQIPGQADSVFNYNNWVDPDQWIELSLADVNECLDSSSCIKATCTNTVGSYFCTCNPGHAFKAGSTTECEDVNECQTGAAQCASPTTCINTEGSYYCKCPDGYNKKTGTKDQCEDVDECTNSPCDDFKSTCENLMGSYRCNCKTGYKNLDSKTCINANECSMGTDSCNKTSSTCVDTEGDYYCSCKTGYTQGVDKKACVAIYCGPLSASASSTLEPARCTKANSNVYGDKCVKKCNEGYVIDNIQNGILTCGSNGLWQGNAGVCNAISCPALPAISDGTIFPSTCLSSGAKYRETCSYSCTSGFTLVGQGSRTCLADKTWDGAEPACQKIIVKPWISCPDNIYQDLASGQSTADVSGVWKEPTSNVQQITISPPEISSSYQFPAGETKVQWTASNQQGSESCSIYVIIRDKEVPNVQNCPSDIYETSDNGKAVTWVEPTFTDNVGVVTVDKTFNSGDTFQLGTTNVQYKAFDAAGNNVACEFTVTLKRPACHNPDGPLDGTKQCSDFGGTNFCTVTCPSGSVLYKATLLYWQCNGGVWSPSDVIPDCVVSVKKDPNTPCEEGRIEMSVVGWVGSELHCTKCPKGMYRSSASDCSPCPSGTYNDQQGQLQCTQKCPSGFSSLPGAKSAAECRVLCPAGRYSVDGLGPNCQDCPRDTYQNQPMSTRCISCPNGTHTLAPGADSLDKCGSKPVARILNPDHTVQEKQTAKLDCVASGKPTPSYRWKFLRDIPPDFLGKMSQESLTDSSGNVIGSRLVITGATYENTGTYECTATNSHGSAMAFAKLTVEIDQGGSGAGSL